MATLWILASILLLFGVTVSARTETCTSEDIAMLNAKVNETITEIEAQNLRTTEDIWGAACNETLDVYELTQEVFKLLLKCKNETTDAHSKTFGEDNIDFTVLMIAESYDYFCDCYETYYMLGDIINETTVDKLSMSLSGPYPTVVYTPQLCYNETFNLPKGLTGVARNGYKCSVLYEMVNNSFVTNARIHKMTAYVNRGFCVDSHTMAANWTCIESAVTSAEFAYCMSENQIGNENDTEAEHISDTRGCRRVFCIEDNIGRHCGAESASDYQWAAGIFGSNETEVNIWSDCNAASSLMTSLLLMTVTSILLIF